ncbi:MAG: hypothetical protein ACLQVG_30200 [Terriglobia bacterium]
MGLTWQETRVLIEHYKTQGPLGRTATLGRNVLWLSRGRLASLVRSMPGGAKFIAELPKGEEYPYADKLFTLLGATEVVSIDYSDYEGASVVHDMNAPIPQHYRDSFDFLYDGGTLEHIFNFPQAIKNCMDLLKVGGTFVASTPANNFMGHGFYQFSPELFFRLFCPENGFRLDRALVFEWGSGGARYEVEDPQKLRRRAELWATGGRILLCIEARKVEAHPGGLPLLPQQSDYVAQWKTEPPKAAGKSLRQSLRAYADNLYPGLTEVFRGLRDKSRFRSYERKGLRADREAYKRIP